MIALALWFRTIQVANSDLITESVSIRKMRESLLCYDSVDPILVAKITQSNMAYYKRYLKRNAMQRQMQTASASSSSSSSSSFSSSLMVEEEEEEDDEDEDEEEILTVKQASVLVGRVIFESSKLCSTERQTCARMEQNKDTEADKLSSMLAQMSNEEQLKRIREIYTFGQERLVSNNGRNRTKASKAIQGSEGVMQKYDFLTTEVDTAEAERLKKESEANKDRESAATVSGWESIVRCKTKKIGGNNNDDMKSKKKRKKKLCKQPIAKTSRRSNTTSSGVERKQRKKTRYRKTTEGKSIQKEKSNRRILK
jgi:hypothetical protein